MPLMVDTPTYRSADRALEGTLTSTLRRLRRKGWSGERIARELYTMSDGQIEVTGETVRSWLRQLGLMG